MRSQICFQWNEMTIHTLEKMFYIDITFFITFFLAKEIQGSGADWTIFFLGI